MKALGLFRASVALNKDGGPLAERFIHALQNAHHSFALQSMPLEEAEAELLSGRLPGTLTIPEGFSRRVKAGETVPIDIEVGGTLTSRPGAGKASGDR